MKKLALGLLVLVLILTSLLVSCSTTTTSSTQPPPVPSSTQSIATPATTPAVTSSPSVPPTTGPSPTTTTATTTDWWSSKWGTPQYGGKITIASNSITSGFDTYNWMNGFNDYYNEPLWIVNPTLDRTKVDLTSDWTLYNNFTGNLAKSWSWSDPSTLVVHLRQDVNWQNKAPVNGRQFTADDVVFHFDRMLGTGNGFTTPNPFFVGRTSTLQKVTAQDKFTVVFKFGTPSVFVNSEAIIEQPILQAFEAPEVYSMGSPIISSQGGPGNSGSSSGASGLNSALNDWHNAVGTGPFILSNFVSGSIVSYTKNPNYWAYDERYPDNRLPYADALNVVYMGSTATEEAALRTGKIDIMPDVTWQDAATLRKSNPDLINGPEAAPGQDLALRVDEKPFSDINVRKALQLAIDLPAIAKGYYGGTVSPTPVGLINPAYTGFTLPYAQWPTELQQEYSYNPTKAKQLLTDAGYPNGFTVTCDAASGGHGGFSDLQLLQVVQTYFKAINVTMNIQTYDASTLMSMVGAKKQDPMVSSTLSTTMPPLMGMNMYIASEPTNAIEQTDPKWEQMVAACKSAPDLATAQKDTTTVDQYFLQQHWVVTTFLNSQYILWQPSLKGYDGEKVSTLGFNSSPYYARMWINESQ